MKISRLKKKISITLKYLLRFSKKERSPFKNQKVEGIHHQFQNTKLTNQTVKEIKTDFKKKIH